MSLILLGEDTSCMNQALMWPADGDLVRKETYINPLKKNNLGPREAFCIDQQRCIRRSPSGFVLERKVYTPQVTFIFQGKSVKNNHFIDFSLQFGPRQKRYNALASYRHD